ncbi:MAG: hypothetical protein NTZ05_01105 [Chloroflexi bacterium]|nr:hypothetical protein [Chloroflexota bacterium]
MAGRPKTAEFWLDRIAVILENAADPRQLTAAAITQRLEQEAAVLGRTDVPSPSVVTRTIRTHREKSEEERRQYRYLTWPDSFGMPDLPWEAAGPLLEWMAVTHWGGEGRPTVARARWYWRLTLAAPDAPLAVRDHMAIFISAEDRIREVMGAAYPDGYSMRQMIEWWLAYRPWRSAAELAAYRAAVERGALGNAEAIRGWGGLDGEQSELLAPFAYRNAGTEPSAGAGSEGPESV